jgi:hypothetical protein
MYDFRTNLILGFHGCDQEVCDQLLQNPDNIKISDGPHEWLGHGMYFWENNYERAFQFAKDKLKRKEIRKPAVIGAVLNLGNCCDLLDSKNIKLLTTYHQRLVSLHKSTGTPMPINEDAKSDMDHDKLFRGLDCAVIEVMHTEMEKERRAEIKKSGHSEIRLFDSTRGVFWEGKEIYKDSGFKEKNHIQICIRNSNCIKGFFLKRNSIIFPKVK